MVCELSDKEAAALNIKSFMKSFGREVTYEKLVRERNGAPHPCCRLLAPYASPAPDGCRCVHLRMGGWGVWVAAGSSTVVISIDRMGTLLHICATFRGGKYKQKVRSPRRCRLFLPRRPFLVSPAADFAGAPNGG